MHLEVGPGHKALVAQGTEELEVLRVARDNVALETVPDAESLAAIAAVHWPLPSVHAYVHG